MVKQVSRLDKQLEIQSAAVEVRKPKSNRKLFFKRNQWLPQNRWLLKGFGLTLCVSLGATVALLTPIWNGRDRANESGQKLSLDAKPQDSIWTNSFQYQLSRSLNILVMGFSVSSATGNLGAVNGPSDTILLLRLNPIDNSVKILSIPQSSQVIIPGIGLNKISLANVRGGSALAARTVSRTLNNVTIDGYVRINSDGLRELVELLGGVEVFVPQTMAAQNNSQLPDIALDPGWQTLSGNQAEKFAQFVAPTTGDLGRIQRQQILMQALGDRLTSPTVLPRLPEISRVMFKYIDTNFTIEQLVALANFGVNIEPQNFQMLLLPGTTSRFSKDPNSYWLDAADINRVMSEYFGVKAIGVTKKNIPLNALKITVQNASNQSNLSQYVAHYLKQHGFNNVYIGSDWFDRQRRTQVIVQKGDLAGATAIQKILGLGSINVAATGDLKSDITIRVGQDWEAAK